MPVDLKRFLLVYSSQTGQAKAIAEEVAAKAPEHGFEADIHCISETEKRVVYFDERNYSANVTLETYILILSPKSSNRGYLNELNTWEYEFWLERENLAVIITSTTGDGDPPDTANKFWRRLKKKTLERTHLSYLRFSLLGLGDSNYSSFCNCAHNFQRRLEELGAVPFYKAAFADDAVGLELVVEPWIEDLFPALRKELYRDADADYPPGTGQVTNGSDIILTDGGAITVESTQLFEEVADARDGVSAIVKPSVPISGLTKPEMDSISSNVANGVDASLNKAPTVPNETLGDSLENSYESANRGPSNSASQVVGSDIVQAETAEGVNHLGRSLTQSIASLAESVLTLPVLPAKYLKLSYQPEGSLNGSRPELQNGHPFPSANSEVVTVTIVKAEQLTSDDAGKKTIKITLNLEDCSLDWRPGDSFGLLSVNAPDEVEALLQRLGAPPDTPYTLEVVAGTKKRSAAVPPHVPSSGTLRNLLLHCLDIRSPPKKALLRCLVDCTSSPREVRRLQELCSKQGADSYTRYVREPGVCLLDLLTSFPSCCPAVERLIEHLPRLQPRPYSAASSPVVSGRQVDLVFNLVEIPDGGGRCGRRAGVCTGYLDRLTAGMQGKPGRDLARDLQAMTLTSPPQVAMYLRSNQHFRPPASLHQPIIMIGPGTGVAPFVGFLQEREKALADATGSDDVGECWLFFGCRHRDRDYIFRDELVEFERRGVLSRLAVCFSRDDDGGDAPRYVQDLLRHNAGKVLSLVVDSDAVVYVCGDARGMARGVNETFCKLLQSERGYSENDAIAFLMKMRLDHRYKEDVWT